MRWRSGTIRLLASLWTNLRKRPVKALEALGILLLLQLVTQAANEQSDLSRARHSPD
ncbi:hypothetical protein [uncultured Erythrobacter sp.]|uniref:hypothetical protein n=1 Tax=uncultured Erythrobacter sp. TaxID=263913 RepID=UPI00344FF245